MIQRYKGFTSLLISRGGLGRGFTLIELLTVIAIIGIMSSVVLANLNGARQKARDVKRIADVKQLQLALELHFDVNSIFPATLAPLATTFISVIPTDPINSGSYVYTYTPLPAGGPYNDYFLKALLEQSTNQVLLNDANPGDSYYDVKP